MKLRMSLAIAITATIASIAGATEYRTLEAVLDPPIHHALLIGIDDYSTVGTMWESPLSGSKDVAAIKQVLIRRGIFKAEEIKVLPKRVTKKQIIDAIQTWLIAPAKAHPGSILFMHYSGHGDLIRAPRGIEYRGRPVTYESALVPSDGHNQERDRELLMHDIATMFDAIKGQAKNVTLSFDSCHSGFGVRAAGFRTRGPKGTPQIATSRGQSTLGAMDDGSLRGYTVLCAAESSQAAGEDDNGGYFTQAFVKTLDRQRGPVSYQAFFEQLKSAMTLLAVYGNQIPTLEADTNEVMFSGEMANPYPAHYSIRRSDQGLVIDGGQVHGLVDGTKVALFKPGADVSNGANQIGEGIIRKPDTATSQLVLTPETHRLHKVEEFDGAGALVEEQSVNAGVINVEIAGSRDVIQQALTTSLNSSTGPTRVVSTGKPDCRVVIDGDAWSIVDPRDVTRNSEVLTHRYPRTTAGIRELKEALGKVAKHRLISDLPTNENQAEVNVDIQVVKVSTDPGRSTAADDEILVGIAPADGHGREFGPKDRFAVRIMAKPHDSDGALLWRPYVAVLQLAANYSIQPLWPAGMGGESVNQVPEAGKWYWLGTGGGGLVPEGGRLDQIQVWRFNPLTDGIGSQTFKVMVTREAVNFTPLAQGSVPRDGTPALGILIARYTGGQRAQTVTPKPREWFTAQASVTNHQ